MIGRWRSRAPGRLALALALLGVAAEPARAAEPEPALAAEPAAPPERVVVRRGKSLSRRARRAPTLASWVISGDELEAAGATASSVLARAPGVQVTRTGAQADLATASIRGADASQVPVYLAGVRLNDEVSGTADLSKVPLFMLDRVEVFRGHAPADADRLGLGGAIFFWPRLPRRTRASLGQGVGSFGEREHSGSFEAGSPTAGVLFSLRHASADNDYSFVNDRGQRFDLDERRERRQNADYRQTDAWLVGRASLGGGVRASAVAHALSREQGVTGLAAVPARAARARTRRYLAGHAVHLPCGGAGCSLSLSGSFVAASTSLSDPFVELATLRTRQLDSSGLRIEHGVTLRNQGERLDWSLALRAAATDLHVDRRGNRPRRGSRLSALPRASLSFRAAERLELSALAGLECHGTSGAFVRLNATRVESERPCGLLQPVGRASARLRLARGLETMVNLGRYVRLPTLSELYGSSPAVEGNDELTPELGHSLDAGVVARFDGFGALRVATEAFAFARSVDQLIRYRRSGIQTLSPYNVASARLLGVEWATTVEIGERVSAESSLSLLDPRETTDDPALDPTENDVLPNSSRLTYSLGLGYRYPNLPQWSGLRQARVDLRYLHRSSRFEDPAGQNVLPAQDFVDLELSLASVGDRLLVKLASRNVFDWQGSDLIGLPVPGRSFHASAEGFF